VCRAAILAGAIEDISGGEIMVTLGKPKNEYGGGVKNGVKSLPAKGNPNEPSFTVTDVKYICPLA